MRCTTCATENPAGNSFCESCGARLRMACAQCGADNSPSARFCGTCGASLIGVNAELKHATVLFADIAGSTELISGLEPEQAQERLQPAIAILCAAVTRFDGTVVRTLGDGIMAMFGAPRAQEGHALLACEAALAMQAELAANEGGPMIRVGLHSGEVVSRSLSHSPGAVDNAHGVTIHLASRIQSIAEPGATYLSEDCYRLVRAYCDVNAIGRRRLKGLPEPVEIYRLVGLKPAIASQQFRHGNLALFRGRRREVAFLQRALSESETAQTKVIGVSGPPGSGKSRLCYEFAEWCRSRLIPVMELRAHPYGHATPFQVVLEFLRLLFGIAPNDDLATSRRRIAEQLLAVAPTFELDLPLLFGFLGIAADDAPRSLADPKARYARLLDIVRHLVRHRGAATSVMIVEDLHWLDEASGEFVRILVDEVASTRTMLVLNFRPSYAAPWMEYSYYRALSLGELSPDATRALVEELIGGRPELADVRDRVAQRSGGNPFFAEELVRSLADNGAVLGELGDYRAGTTIAGSALPATIEAVIGGRIDRLDEVDKAVLQIGAIIGKEFPVPVLQQVLGPLAGQSDVVLGRLCDAELIYEQTGADHRQFAFRHPLTQEVAYATQLKARRSALHAAVAAAMEGFHRDRLNEFSGLIAYHYEAAGRRAEAAHYAARAATWVGSTNPAQAIKHWQKVRGLLQDEPRSPTTDSQLIIANGQIAWLGWREGMTADEATLFLREALDRARATDDTMIPLLLFVEGRIAVASGGSADTYVARVREALSLVDARINPGRVATLQCAMSQAYGWAGLLKDALAANDAAVAGLPKVEPFDHGFLGYNVDHWVISLRARILVRLGRFAEGEAHLEDLLRNEQVLLDPTVQFIPHLGYVDLAWCRGDAGLAEKHAARIGEIAGKTGIPYLRVYEFACNGTAKSLAGDLEGAVRDFAQGLKFIETAKASMGFEPEVQASLAECYYRLGDAERATSLAREAIAIARQRATRLAECRASIICAAALLAQHGAARLSEAEGLFDRAAKLIEVTGARIYLPLLERERQRAAVFVG